MSSLFLETLCPNPDAAHPQLLLLNASSRSRHIIRTVLETAVDIRIGTLITNARPARWEPLAADGSPPEYVVTTLRKKFIDPDLCLTISAAHLTDLTDQAWHVREAEGLRFSPLWLITETL